MLARMSLLRAVATAAIVATLASCGVRARPVDTTRLVAELGLDGAAEALRIRIAGNPRDIPARRALAELEDRRGRPGAVLAELSAVRDLGGPLGARLSDRERDRLAALVRERARARAARGSPDAIDDLDLARRIAGGRGEDAAVRREAELHAALADLRHTDPDRRARGAERLGRDTSTVDGQGATGLFLWEHGARRAAFELLDEWERAGGRERAGADTAATVDAWLAARAWWRGPGGRPDLATLERAVASGGSPCRFAVAPGDHGCTAAAIAGGPARERELLARARARGWRTSDPEEAAAWVAITAAAWQRGELRSWLDELDARVDLAALGLTGDGDARLPAAVPAWARAPLLRAAGRRQEADLALSRARADADDLPAHARLVLDAATTPRPHYGALHHSEAAVLAAAVADGLSGIADAYRTDPAAADRLAEDVVARDVDVAAAAPGVAELFQVLGDPARARAWWERAVEASPDDVGLRAGLVRALAAAADGEAARLHLTTVAAGSGDPARALLDGARALAAAGLTVDALAPAKQALELIAPGEEQEALQLLIELAGRLDRADQVQSFTAALDRVRTAPDATTLRARAAAGDAEALARAFAADPSDAGLAIAVARGEADAARALEILTEASRWNPADVELRVERLTRGDRSALDELAGIAAAPGLPRETRQAAAIAYARGNAG
jgi:Tfp pilus assembly protein PilF